MRATLALLTAVASLSLVSGGCVTKRKYNELQSQYDDLASQYASTQQSEAGLKMEVNELEEHVTRLRNSNEYLGSFYADLLSEFRPQLEADQVEVIVYPDRMSLALAQDVTFGTGRAGLTGVGDDTLATLADLVKRHPDRRFNVEGHTDDVPIDTARYASNWELGAARAVAVVKALIADGVPAERLAATSYADTQPLANNGTADARQVNRRVEISFQPTLEELPGHQMLLEAAKKVIYAEGGDRSVVTEPGRPAPSTQDEQSPTVPVDTRGEERANDG